MCISEPLWRATSSAKLVELAVVMLRKWVQEQHGIEDVPIKRTLSMSNVYLDPASVFAEPFNPNLASNHHNYVAQSHHTYMCWSLASQPYGDNQPSIIEDEEVAMNGWIKLQTDYTKSGLILRFTKMQELWNATMSSSKNSVETYITSIRIKPKGLNRMGAPIDNWILVALLLNGLDGKYKDFVHHLDTQRDDMPDFDTTATLLHEEDRLLKRDNNEQATASRKENPKGTEGQEDLRKQQLRAVEEGSQEEVGVVTLTASRRTVQRLLSSVN